MRPLEIEKSSLVDHQTNPSDPKFGHETWLEMALQGWPDRLSSSFSPRSIFDYRRICVDS
jgi:hypothetical protein